MIQRIFIFLFCCSAISTYAQLPANAISYSLTVDLKKFDGEAAQELDDTELLYETDLYYTADKVRTVTRVVKRPDDYELTFRQRLYDQNSTDEYNIEYPNRTMVMKEKHVYKPKSTGKTKKILNYTCKEYQVVDFRGNTITFWVTDKLGKNVCPWGNFSLKGTALEIIASNGLHFKATDFAAGELEADFFNVPQGFETQKIPFPEVKKTK
ncbi:MAG TPA: hypothetical protein VGK59_22150 [Ohtaekwangia sp.]